MVVTDIESQLCGLGLNKDQAHHYVQKIHQWQKELSAASCWQKASRFLLKTQQMLKARQNFALHQCIFHYIYQDWQQQQGPAPVWFPDANTIETSNIARIMRVAKQDNYRDLHRWSVEHRQQFWAWVIENLGVVFKQTPSAICDLSQGVEYPDWMPGASMNIVDSCFLADDDVTAIIYQSEADGDQTDKALTRVSYGQLLRMVNRVANSLLVHGFAPGDAIAIDMPMTIEAVAIYLGIIKAGCCVVAIAESFTANEIEARCRIAKAKGIFTQDVINRHHKVLPLYQKVVDAKVPRAIVLPAQNGLRLALRAGDLLWQDFLGENDDFDSHACTPNTYANILFSSGTTGAPKAIPWTHTTPIKCAGDAFLHHDIKPGNVLAWPTSLGWMMGPWLVFAALMNKATIALYEGSPLRRAFGQFVQDAEVTMLGLVPSLVRAWRQSGCMQGLDWRNIRAFSSSGECSNPEDMFYLMWLADYRPIIEYCGGTEIGGAYITGTMVQAAAPATFSTPTLGLDWVLLNENGQIGELGEVALLPPSIGLSNELLNCEHHQVYYQDMPQGPNGETLRRHGDQMERLGVGYYRAQGRVDDSMNLGGIKISSVQIEACLTEVEEISETAAVGIPQKGGGPERLVIFAVPEDLQIPLEPIKLKASMQNAIKEHLNPLFKIHKVVLIKKLPRTASNKVMRRMLRAEYTG